MKRLSIGVNVVAHEELPQAATNLKAFIDTLEGFDELEIGVSVLSILPPVTTTYSYDYVDEREDD